MGVPKIYKFGTDVAVTSWKGVNEKKKRYIEKKTDSIALKILKNNGRVKAGIKTKGFFFIMRMLQKSGWNEAGLLIYNVYYVINTSRRILYGSG